MIISIELGSSHIKVFDKTKGLVFYEPSVLLVKNKGTRKKIITFGLNAMEHIDTLSPDEEIIRPIKNGTIDDFASACNLLDLVLNKLIGKKSKRGNTELILCVSTCINEVEIDEYLRLAKKCGIINVTLKPQLSCICSLLDDDTNAPYLIVDIGAGKTEIGFVSSNHVINAVSLSLSGNMFELAIYESLKQTYNISVPSFEIEKLISNIASLYSTDDASYQIYAQNLEDLNYQEYTISSRDLYDGLVMCYDKLIDGIHAFINDLDEEYQEMIANTGIFFSGVGSLINGFEKYMQSKFEQQIYILDLPSIAVVEGALMFE